MSFLFLSSAQCLCNQCEHKVNSFSIWYLSLVTIGLTWACNRVRFNWGQKKKKKKSKDKRDNLECTGSIIICVPFYLIDWDEYRSRKMRAKRRSRKRRIQGERYLVFYIVHPISSIVVHDIKFTRPCYIWMGMEESLYHSERSIIISIVTYGISLPLFFAAPVEPTQVHTHSHAVKYISTVACVHTQELDWILGLYGSLFFFILSCLSCTQMYRVDAAVCKLTCDLSGNCSIQLHILPEYVLHVSWSFIVTPRHQVTIYFIFYS